MNSRQRGFTLIELMVVVIIVAILVIVALPSYRQYLVRSNRNVAKGDLMELQQWMERNYSLTNAYDKLPSGSTLSVSSLPFSKSSRDSSAPHYLITFSSGPASSTYTLLATAQSNQNDPECGNLSLTNAGVRGVSGSGTVANCWNN